MDISLLLPILLTFLVMVAMVTDATSFRIPNWVNGVLLVFYPIALLVVDTQMEWSSGLLAFAVVFAIGYGMFVFRLAGGGDIKMLSVLALWVGWGQVLVTFVLVMAILGGVLTLVLLVARQLMPLIVLRLTDGKGAIPRVLTQGEPLPYGLAIGVAFLWMLWTGQLPVYG